MGKLKKNIKKNPRILLALLTLILVIATGIVFKQKFYRMLPICISLVVLMLESKANRYSFVIGAINSCIYGIVYISMQVYASAASAFLFSFPVQIVSFIKWNKRKYENSTVFKRFDLKEGIFTTVGFIALWFVFFFSLRDMNSPYLFIDTTASAFGIIASIVCMLTYYEYIYINLISAILSLFLYMDMTINDISQIVFMILGVYTLVCRVAAFIYVRQLLAIQRKDINIISKRRNRDE